MNQFITIKQASILTGKAEITIRRLIKRLNNQNNAESTQLIKQEKTSAGYQYQVNKIFLLKELKMDYLLNTQASNQKSIQADHLSMLSSDQEDLQNKKEAKISGKEPDQTITHVKKERESGTVDMMKEIISILRDQLKVKDDQLHDKHEENQELIRGNREAVATINLLTKKLLLADGNESSEPESEIVPREQAHEDNPKKKKSLFNFFK